MRICPVRTRSPGLTRIWFTSAKIRLTSVAVVRARTTPPASNGCTAGSSLATWTGTSIGVRESAVDASRVPEHAANASVAVRAAAAGILCVNIVKLI